MAQEKNPFIEKVSIWLPLLLGITLAGGMLIGIRLDPSQPVMLVKDEESYSESGQGKIEELLRYVEAKYVDEVDREELVDKAIEQILTELDPHSVYFTEEEVRQVNEQLDGNFNGIGIEFLIVDDTLVVVTPLSGGPSEAAGILPGDKIVEVEDSVITGADLDVRRVKEMLRGKKGTPVEIGIVRGEEQEIRHFTIIRDKIPWKSVDVAYMLDERTGYIKISRFSATTYEEFMQSLEHLIDRENMSDLIIDLRKNPGGYLPQATNILNQLFMRKDKLLVYTEGRNVSRMDYESTGRAFFDIGEVAILIDEGSASASEIMAGAVQDHDRGIIVGRRSFGKGLVQEQYKLRDGSALRLSVARYYTPSGRSIQRDYKDREQYESDFLERLDSGELTAMEYAGPSDSTRYYTYGGRVVYGGRGITPDIFVPLDTLVLNEQFLELRSIIDDFAFLHIEENTEDFADPDLDRFRSAYTVEDELMTAFLDYARERGVVYESFPLREEGSALVKKWMKAYLARYLFEDEGFF
ncbi:MAG: S41 family peptidase, partial [Saprospiraceae bacterium]|nr:S41 family peptidase [Saprospiraceae bacterium]